MSWFWKKEVPPKPEDRIEYRLGFSCEDGHCQWIYASDTAVRSILWEEQICRVCGAKAFPSVVKIHLGPDQFPFGERTEQILSREFVRFLDEDTVRLSEEVTTRLKTFARRKFADVGEDPGESYHNGLHDGVSMAAQYVLGELKEEPK